MTIHKHTFKNLQIFTKYFLLCGGDEQEVFASWSITYNSQLRDWQETFIPAIPKVCSPTQQQQPLPWELQLEVEFLQIQKCWMAEGE